MIAFDFPAVLEEWPLLLRGAAFTWASRRCRRCSAWAWAWPAAGRARWGPAWLARLVAVYVELIRNTPFIVQLFFIFFGLPSLGVKLTPELASVIAMVVNLGAYAAEIVRAGIEGTARGQFEAARSLAMTEAQVFLRVVLPPSLARVWPAMVSQMIIVMLGSAVCGQIAAQEF